jgi:hypothetical protein
MSKPFFERLKEYYSSIALVLRDGVGASRIFPNAGDIGSSRERIYAQFLKSHLPPSCNVQFGGFLFDQHGKESKQIDILVTDESTLQFKAPTNGEGGKSFACVDGTIAVVSVKSTLDSTRLSDSLLNISSIPDKQPLTSDRVSFSLKIGDFDDWPYKIVYASDGIELETMLNALKGFYEKQADIPLNKRPNLIHVLGKYAIVRTGQEGGVTRDGTRIEPNKFHGMSDPNGVIGLVSAATAIQRIASASKHIFYRYNEMLNNIPL